MTNPFTYKITFQPLTDATTYATSATDVTDYVNDPGLGTIINQLDSYDFDIGVFHHGNMTIGCTNEDGYFNETEAIFSFKRDLTKVVIYFYDEDETEYTFFKGVISEPLTRFNKNNKTVNFTVINQENVLSQAQVEVADISNGDSFSDSIKAILNKTTITTVLNYDATNITVDYDGEVDVASELQGLDVYSALKQLLQASNSIFYVNDDDDMIVSNRDQINTETTFYGAEDPFGRDNIIELTGYTTGYNRIFNSIVVNGTESKDATSITAYGLRQKRFTFDFINDAGREALVGAGILAEIKDPKKEALIAVPIEDATALNLLEKIILTLESSEYNSINIDSDDTFKILGRNYIPKDQSAVLKLREI